MVSLDAGVNLSRSLYQCQKTALSSLRAFKTICNAPNPRAMIDLRSLAPAITAFAFSLCLRAEAPLKYAPPEPSLDVAEQKLDWHDAARDRDVPVKIYFPKSGAGPFPVIVFSHGLGGSRDGYEYLGRHWAGCGYVSVHLQHVGSDDSIWKDLPPAERAKSVQAAAMNLTNALNRPPDVQFVLGEIGQLNREEMSPLKGRLDLKALAVAGHSFGGYTTLALAGQTFLLPLGRSKRYDEPRIKAAIQMSAPVPANRRALDETYGTITIPVMHMTGTEDFLEMLPQTSAADRRLPFDHMDHAETCLVIFQGGDHFIFSGRERVGASPELLARDAVFQKLVCAGTTAFWDAYLKGRPEAKSWLLDGGYGTLLGGQAVFQKKNPVN